MRQLIYGILAISLLVGCAQEAKPLGWKYTSSIAVNGVNPIGIASAADGLWLSDGDHFRVVKINEQGKITQSIDSLDRPMHIAYDYGELVIPQYGNDEVMIYNTNDSKHILPFIVFDQDSLDAPAGADINGNEIAIADFYNNRILYNKHNLDKDWWISFGKEGKADGDFYYPTDVQITQDALWVADAYNNRLQKFTKEGKHLLTIGEDQNMNAATGIYVSKEQVFSTDFENDRVLVFDLDGNFLQELKDDVNKPTDVLIQDGRLYIANYKSSSLSVYDWGEIEVLEEAQEEHHHEHHGEESEKS